MRVVGDKNQISEDVFEFMISYLTFPQKSIRSALAKLLSISILCHFPVVSIFLTSRYQITSFVAKRCDSNRQYLSSLIAVSETWWSQCMCVCAFMCVCVCVCAPEFVWTITSAIVDGFQNNLTKLFSITCKYAI